MKVTICVFIILIYNANLFSQKSKNRLGNQYSQGIDYYLSPGKNDSKREILFISKPSFNSPEYSVALEKKESSSILILRSFKSNYWELVFSKRSSPIDMVYSKIDSFVVCVSKGFEDKLKFYFQTVLRDSLISRIFDTYDGTTYQISDKKYFREVHDFEFSINKKYYQLIVICETLAYNLRKGDFDEKWYSDLIDKTLTPDEK